jgi:hypothetical protein
MTLRHFFIIIATLFFVRSASAQTPHLPMDHWGYEFMERLETRGLLDQAYFRTLPLSRGDIARALQGMGTRLQSGAISLSATERALFEKLKGELADELVSLGVTVQAEELERHAWSHTTSAATIHLDAHFAERAVLEGFSGMPDTLNSSRTTIGARLRGKLSKNLAFYADFYNTLIKGEDLPERNYDASAGLPISGSGGNRFIDQTIGYLVYKFPWAEILAGRDVLHWGPGHTDALTVSGSGEVFDQIRATVDFSRFRYTAVVGWLNSSIDKKRLAAHRVDIRATSRLNFAMMETVIYGGRGVQFIYANPLTVYHIAEKHAGDKDNNTISFEANWRMADNLRIYTEFFFDDYSLSEHPLDFWGNKWAVTGGVHWTNPAGLRDSDLRVEYVRIEPWVYTHWKPINVYTNYDRSLGHPLGPNADLLLVEFRRYVNRSLRLIGSLEHRRRGRGDILTQHFPWDGTKKEFLDGTVESATAWRAGIRYEALRDVFWQLDYRYRPHNNYRRQPGLDVTGHQAALSLTIDY